MTILIIIIIIKKNDPNDNIDFIEDENLWRASPACNFAAYLAIQLLLYLIL